VTTLIDSLQKQKTASDTSTKNAGYTIPFNRPCFAGAEQEYIAQSIANSHISGDGPFTKKCHSLLEEITGAKKALLTTSCTHALEMSAILLDIKEGDEVIVPSFTFVSTINAFVLRGAKPVFVDVRPDTLNLDEKLVKGAITAKTKAIVPVHYAGVGCEMDEIMAAAGDIPVVEDNAHGFFGKYKGRNLGSFGQMSTLSFHETKNFHCGEGGALILNDERLIERAEIIREKGTNRSRFFRGQVDKYSWVDVGSSYLPSDLLAAFLFAQLQANTTIQSKRQSIWNLYKKHLQEWAEKGKVVLPTVPEHCLQPYHMFYMLLPSLQVRTALIQHLKQKGILAVYHYLPLHISDMGKRYGGKVGDCPVTEDISDRLLRLPFYNSLTEEDQLKVVDAILKFSEFQD
jgi:dTDP-4-amino-4,6-dideoxygalactose transaminase